MEPIVEIIKDFFVPGSFPVFIFGLIIGVLLLYRRGSTAEWGKRWLTFLIAFYFAMSTPLGVRLIEAPLNRGYTSQIDSTSLGNVPAIVVLGGGSSSLRTNGQDMEILSKTSILRVWEGARLYNYLDNPWIVVSGGLDQHAGVLTPESIPMRDILIDAGIPEERILLETSSSNTYEQAVYLHPLLDAHGIDRFALVTSPIHMRRAYATFTAQGLNPIPAPSLQHPKDFLMDRVAFLPNSSALGASHEAMREFMALAYYALRGWFAAP